MTGHLPVTFSGYRRSWLTGNHERELPARIDEERLKYVGLIVLGLNDALVDFTGTLAGLTFAIQNTQIITVEGLINGFRRLTLEGGNKPMLPGTPVRWQGRCLRKNFNVSL